MHDMKICELRKIARFPNVPYVPHVSMKVHIFSAVLVSRKYVIGASSIFTRNICSVIKKKRETLGAPPREVLHVRMDDGTSLAKDRLCQLSYSFKNAKPARDTMSVPVFEKRQCLDM